MCDGRLRCPKADFFFYRYVRVVQWFFSSISIFYIIFYTTIIIVENIDRSQIQNTSYIKYFGMQASDSHVYQATFWTLNYYIVYVTGFTFRKKLQFNLNTYVVYVCIVKRSSITQYYVVLSISRYIVFRTINS